MATVFLSPFPTSLLSNSATHLAPQLFFLRNHTNLSISLKKCKSQGKIVAHSTISPLPNSEIGFHRRDFMLFGFSASLALVLPSSGVGADEDAKMVDFVDDINSYTYLYPAELPSKKIMFKWVESRKPERYSSAAPLSPNARLRIVSERVDFIDNVVISVSIGPPNSEFLKTKDKHTWNAKDVADSVLSDKSALRVTSTQRLDESSILDAHSSDIDGEPYWMYEYLVRKSPTKYVQDPTNYRQYVASTAERDGYLYTLNASTLSKQWNLMGPILKRTVDSFRLVPPAENYVPPYKDPWRFW